MAMREQISILVKLQAIDSDIRNIEKRLGKVDGEKAALDSELEAFASSIKEKSSIGEEYQKTFRSLESDANMNIPKIAKSKGKLTSVKTNKEYQALLKEIEDLKTANSNTEDQMLEILEQSDTAEVQLREEEHQFESAKIRVAEEKDAWYLNPEEYRDKTGESGDAMGKDFDIVVNFDLPENNEIQLGFGHASASRFFPISGRQSSSPRV